MSPLKDLFRLRTGDPVLRRQVFTGVQTFSNLHTYRKSNTYIQIQLHLKRNVSTLNNTTDRNIARRNATQNWIDTIVIGQKLCPFAPPVRGPPQLRIALSNASNATDVVEEVIKEATILVGKDKKGTNENEKQPHPQTTLLVLDEELYPEMRSFRSLVELSWRLQTEAIDDHGYTPMLQLVLFHPLAKHDTYSEYNNIGGDGDAADYSIRSPYPTIHLLQEEDVMKAVKSGYKDLELLPSRNKAKLREEGLDVCQKRLDSCME